MVNPRKIVGFSVTVFVLIYTVIFFKMKSSTSLPYANPQLTQAGALNQALGTVVPPRKADNQAPAVGAAVLPAPVVVAEPVVAAPIQPAPHPQQQVPKEEVKQEEPPVVSPNHNAKADFEARLAALKGGGPSHEPVDKPPFDFKLPKPDPFHSNVESEEGARKDPARNTNLQLADSADYNGVKDPSDPQCWVPRPLDVDRCGPRFFVLGPFKGGTTSVYKYLSKHPSVRIKESANANVRLKETHFFTRVNTDAKKQLPTEIKRYMDSFPVILPGEHLVTGEASPSYIFDPNSPKRLHDIFPDGRLILMAREPVDRAYSQLNHFIKLSMPTIADTTVLAIYDFMVESTLPNMHRCMEGSKLNDYTALWKCFMGSDAGSGGPRGPEAKPPKGMDAGAGRMATRAVRMKLLERGLYYYQLVQWHKTFPVESLLVVCAEDFYSDTVKAMERIGQHVGLDPIDWEPVVKVKYNVAKDRANHKMALDLLPEAPDMPKHTITPSTRGKLQRFYRPHNQKLAEYTGMPQLDWPYPLADLNDEELKKLDAAEAGKEVVPPKGGGGSGSGAGAGAIAGAGAGAGAGGGVPAMAAMAPVGSSYGPQEFPRRANRPAPPVMEGGMSGLPGGRDMLDKLRGQDGGGLPPPPRVPQGQVAFGLGGHVRGAPLMSGGAQGAPAGAASELSRQPEVSAALLARLAELPEDRRAIAMHALNLDAAVPGG